MKHFGMLFILTAGLVATISCKSQYEILLSSNDVDAKYAAAFDYFNRGKYLKASQLFESMAQFTNGTERDDTVQFYWGLSNYRYKDFLTAETNFGKFLENFPRSPFADEASFLRIDCLYRSTLRYELDQTPTRTAMATIAQYLAETGGSHREACEHMLSQLQERLDKKELENAKLYYKMEDYLASRVAFRNILKDNADNVYREEVLYYTAMSSYKYASMSVAAKQRERYLTFVDDYLNFVGELPDSKYRRELDVMYKRAQKALGRFSGSEEELEEKTVNFEKERRVLEKEQKKNNETSGKKRS